MRLEDLSDPLDPAADPFQPIRPKLSTLIAVLRQQVARGFRFTVYEDYSSLSFDLKDILNWSKRDLDDPGIDFTSSHHSATGYAHNYHGSQLKQNLKYITDHLPAFRKDPVLAAGMTAEDWRIVDEVNKWISGSGTPCIKIVIWVRRPCPAFEVQGGCLPVGSFDYFIRRVMAVIERNGLSLTQAAIEMVVPPESREFYVRAQRPILRAEIEKIEEVRSRSWRQDESEREWEDYER